MTISGGRPGQGLGGGMCQCANRIHWMALHSPLTVLERHRHDSLDLFPDFGRQVFFGVGASIAYHYLDYRLRNDADQPFQLSTWVEARIFAASCGLCACRRKNTIFECRTSMFGSKAALFTGAIPFCAAERTGKPADGRKRS